MNKNIMNSPIQFKNHTPELSDGFYHKNSPLLFADHDTITSLKDCPFPLKTKSFKVLSFGTVKDFPDRDPKYGNNGKFAIVEYIKGCGHKVHERINFIENVQDFDHYGTKFYGKGYSINDWEKRIEFFRQYPCAICSMVRHSLWIYKDGMERRKNKHMDNLKYLLDYNYANWQDFVNFDKYVEMINDNHKDYRDLDFAINVQ